MYLKTRDFLFSLCKSMSAFDFNRYRTVENPSSRITARDLQKARRSAARSIIKKSKSPKHPQKQSMQHQAFNAAPTIQDEMSYESRTTAALVSCDGASGAEIRSDLQACIVSETPNSSSGCPSGRNPVADSFRKESVTHEMSIEVPALLMRSCTHPLQLASLALASPALSFSLGSSPSPSTLPPLPPQPQLRMWPPQQQPILLPTLQQKPLALPPFPSVLAHAQLAIALARSMPSTLPPSPPLPAPAAAPGGGAPRFLHGIVGCADAFPAPAHFAAAPWRP